MQLPIFHLPMKHYCDRWIQEWCLENGWTDLFIERCNNYWAFPPGAVMPEPIPAQVLQVIKAERGMTLEEKVWSASAALGTLLAVISAYVFKCPMPMIIAFAFDAVTAAKLEIEEI